MVKKFLTDDNPKRKQAKEIFQLIHQAGPITKIRLAELTKVKQTTLSRIIDELLSLGLIRESGLGESSGGRPPVLYQVEDACGFLIGIDLARTYTKVGLFDLTFRLRELVSIEMTREQTPERVLSDVSGIIRQWLEAHSVTLDQLLGIGIGSVGPLDRQSGMILEPAAFPAPGWKHVPIVQLLKEKFGVPVTLENGANTAVLAEYIAAGRRPDNMLYCINAAGLRCGVMNNGRLMLNQTGDINSFGHMIIDAGGRLCDCGNRGCLNRYISIPAIIDEASRRLNAGASSLLLRDWHGDPAKISLHSIIQAYLAEDSLAREILLESAAYFGIGIANMVNLVHPQHVILGGRLVYDAPGYYEKAVEMAQKYIYHNLKAKVSIGQGLLQANAAVIGAAMMVFHSFF